MWCVCGNILPVSEAANWITGSTSVPNWNISSGVLPADNNPSASTVPGKSQWIHLTSVRQLLWQVYFGSFTLKRKRISFMIIESVDKRKVNNEEVLS